MKYCFYWREKLYEGESFEVSPNVFEFSVEEFILRIKRDSVIRVFVIMLLRNRQFKQIKEVQTLKWDDVINELPKVLYEIEAGII